VVEAAGKEGAAMRGARGLVGALLLLGVLSARASADEFPLGFGGLLENDLPVGWRAVRFPSISHATEYSIVSIESRAVLHALAKSSASIVVRRVPDELSLERTPVLTWRWRVEKTVAASDGRSRETDDFPARVWVGFETDWSKEGWLDRREAESARTRYGFTPPGYWLHYVWAAKRQPEEAFDEPYQPEHVKCVTLRSGSDALETWFSEAREPARDFERCFHRAAPRVTAVAVMTDSDDTGSTAEALYADLAFVSTHAGAD
jgi:hypothetical protein